MKRFRVIFSNNYLFIAYNLRIPLKNYKYSLKPFNSHKEIFYLKEDIVPGAYTLYCQIIFTLEGNLCFYIYIFWKSLSQLIRMPGYTVKVKTKQGQHVLSDLDPESSVAALKSKLFELTQIPSGNLQIKTGFPPKNLDISNEASTIQAIGVVNGDTLIIEDSGATTAVRDQEVADEELAQALAAENSEFNGILMKKVVPADNSCLFTSIGMSDGGGRKQQNLLSTFRRLSPEWHDRHGHWHVYETDYSSACGRR